MDRAGKVVDIGRIEDMRAVVRQSSVIGAEAVRILDASRNVAVEALPVARSQHLAEGVVDGERRSSSLLLPGGDHRVVIRDTAVREQLDAARVVVESGIIVGRKTTR